MVIEIEIIGIEYWCFESRIWTKTIDKELVRISPQGKLVMFE
jgi:hypothetical protein